MKTLNDLLDNHTTLTVESVDRLYLNGYMPKLQSGSQLSFFMRDTENANIASPVILRNISKRFIDSVHLFAKSCNLEIFDFSKRDSNGRKIRKDDIAKKILKNKYPEEGVYLIGKAQEKCNAFKAGKKIDNGSWLDFSYTRQSVYVNHYYFYIYDNDFGPFFIKFGSYAPYPMRICLNGHEWLKRQLENEKIEYEGLDNGILSCSDHNRLKYLSQNFGPSQIIKLINKWLNKLPLPISSAARSQGYDWRISIWQMEVSNTKVFTRPLRGREFFEELIRENLDIGRPDRLQLIFSRRVTKATPGQFRTRVIQNGVNPSLHIQYKSNDIKQYFKENRGLRTETTINRPKDFDIPKDLSNFWKLRRVGDEVNHNLLKTERFTQDCLLSESMMESIIHPTVSKNGQRASALKFGDKRTSALFGALLLMCYLPMGFSNQTLRINVKELLPPKTKYESGQMSYDLRRLKLKGIINRKKDSNRYHLSDFGLRTACFFTKTEKRIFSKATIPLDNKNKPKGLEKAFNNVDKAIENIINEAKLS